MTLNDPRPVGMVTLSSSKYDSYNQYILSIGQYMNGRIAVMLHSSNGEPYAHVSRNIPELNIEDDEFFVGYYDLSPLLLDGLSKCGYFEDTGARVKPKDSHVELPIWKMKDMVHSEHIGFAYYEE